MKKSLDLAWARRCAHEYATNPTEARARNAAQCLQPLLDAYDFALSQLPATPPQLCRNEFRGLECFLAAGHTGDHSTNVHHREPATWPQTTAKLCFATATDDDGAHLLCGLDNGHTGDHSTNARWTPRIWPKTPQELYDQAPPELCPGYPRAHPEDARLACFFPSGHTGAHSNDPNARKRAGLDPCPARQHRRSCTKGYAHTGSHQWGPNRPIEAGPELPGHAPGCDGIPQLADAGICPCGATQSPTVNCRCTVSHQPSPLELEAEHYRDTTRTIDDGKRPCEGRGCTNRTSMSCSRCGRQNCRMCGAINLKTMIHSDGEPCHSLTYEQATALSEPRQGRPWHFCDETCIHYARPETALGATEPPPEG